MDARIECVYYINLEHRTDRNKEFLEEMKVFGVPESKIIRIDGIYNKEHGIVGCGYSHLKALRTFIKSGQNNCIIFEDDFTFTLDMNYVHFLLREVFDSKLDFDVVMLGWNMKKDEKTSYPFFRRVYDAQTASAYLVTKEFAPKIEQILAKYIPMLEEHYLTTGQHKHEYCNDICWKELQPISKWYSIYPRLGIQRESYSDNEKKITNYRV